MNILSASSHPLRLGCALAILAATTWSQAQPSIRSVQPAVQPTAPAMSPGSAGTGSPRPAGLVSPLPSRGGLISGSPAATGLAPQTHVMGAAVVGQAAPQSAGTGPYTALEIAQSFLGADANRDGELTRAEAQRLSIMPHSFEEMDRNRDGILSRFEYEDGVR